MTDVDPSPAAADACVESARATASSRGHLSHAPAHVGPDQYLQLETAAAVTREDVAAAWERAYAEVERRLREAGPAARLYVVCGLQGAGKSTWIAAQAGRQETGAVYLDGPLPSRRHRLRALAIADAIGCPATAVWIDTPLAVAMARNARRPGLARIRDEAILDVLHKLEPPTRDEGFAEVVHVRGADAYVDEQRSTPDLPAP